MGGRIGHDTDTDVYIQFATNVPSETLKYGSLLRSDAATSLLRDEIFDPKHSKL